MPTLTTLEFQADRLGAEAVGLLIDRLEEPSPDPERPDRGDLITVERRPPRRSSDPTP